MVPREGFVSLVLRADPARHRACSHSPFAVNCSERPISWLDAAFTSTSAACVTGLAVRSTEHDFSFVGQLVILLLIQLGGIGIMTVTTFIMMQFGQRHGLRTRAVDLRDLRCRGKRGLALDSWPSLRADVVVRRVGLSDPDCSAISASDPLPTAAWRALFHSISAFCNAGFALHDDSLMRFQGDLVVNFTIAV